MEQQHHKKRPEKSEVEKDGGERPARGKRDADEADKYVEP